MLYLLEVNALAAAIVTAFVFTVSGFVILGILAWRAARTYAAAQHRIYRRVAGLLTSQSFANSIAISRSFSRSTKGSDLVQHQIQ
jgi:hypothetical protein